MKKIMIFINLLLIISCSKNTNIDEQLLLQQKTEAFVFLSEYHHQLHIMIDEEPGDKLKAFSEFKNASLLINNIELIPVKNALQRINNVNQDYENVKKLDDLVDYYQSGLSIQIEAILRGYGYKEIIDYENILNVYNGLVRG